MAIAIIMVLIRTTIRMDFIEMILHQLNRSELYLLDFDYLGNSIKRCYLKLFELLKLITDLLLATG